MLAVPTPMVLLRVGQEAEEGGPDAAVRAEQRRDCGITLSVQACRRDEFAVVAAA